MTYIPDGEDCFYFRGAPKPIENLESIGWLDKSKPYNKTGRLLDGFINNLKLLIETQGDKHGICFKGGHTCNLCPGNTIEEIFKQEKKWKEPRHSNVIVISGRVNYGAPELLLHYIVDHGYIPPANFQDAVNRAGLRIRLGEYQIVEYTEEDRRKHWEEIKNIMEKRYSPLPSETEEEKERKRQIAGLIKRINPISI